MDGINLAVVDLDEASHPRWMVFTISEENVVRIDSSCQTFGEIVRKYGPIPAMPLTEQISGQARDPSPLTNEPQRGCTRSLRNGMLKDLS